MLEKKSTKFVADPNNNDINSLTF